MHSTIVKNETEKQKIYKIKKINRDKPRLAGNRENVVYMKPFGEADDPEQQLVKGECEF